MASAYYPTITTDDLKKLPVQDITDDNCALFLWVCNPLLQEGLDVMKSWGFTFKTVGFCWDKSYRKSGRRWFGMGSYTRSSMELCLLGVKGRLPRYSHSVYQTYTAPVDRHSEKPQIFMNKMVELFGDIPRIELFARKSTVGWHSLGNAIDGKDITCSLLKLGNKNEKSN